MVATFNRDVHHTEVGTEEQVFRKVDSQRIDISAETDLKNVGEDAGKRTAPNPQMFCDGGQGEIFAEMLSDIVDNFTGQTARWLIFSTGKREIRKEAA